MSVLKQTEPDCLNITKLDKIKGRGALMCSCPSLLLNINLCYSKQSWSGQATVTMTTKHQKRRAHAHPPVLLYQHQSVLKQTELNCESTTINTKAQGRGLPKSRSGGEELVCPYHVLMSFPSA